MKKIRRYLAAIRRLPATREELEHLADFPSLSIDAEDVWVFYENLRSHAAGWVEIEKNCKKMGRDLQVFAESFLDEGNAFIGEVEGILKAGTHLPAEEGASPETEPLPASQIEALKEAKSLYLSQILDDIRDKLQGIRHVAKSIERFKEDIDHPLIPMAESLEKTLLEHNPIERVAELRTKLEQLDPQIKILEDIYSTVRGTSFYGMLFGPIGLIITGGFFGSKAETLREQKDALIQTRSETAATIANLLGQAEAFNGMNAEILDIKFRLGDIVTSVKNLEDVWGLLEAYTLESIEKSEKVTTHDELKTFMVRFRRVVRPWEKILNISVRISEIFNASLEGTD